MWYSQQMSKWDPLKRSDWAISVAEYLQRWVQCAALADHSLQMSDDPFGCGLPHRNSQGVAFREQPHPLSLAERGARLRRVHRQRIDLGRVNLMREAGRGKRWSCGVSSGRDWLVGSTPSAEECALEVDGEHFVPEGFAYVLNGGNIADTGAVDQDVQSPKATNGRIGDCSASRFGCN